MHLLNEIFPCSAVHQSAPSKSEGYSARMKARSACAIGTMHIWLISSTMANPPSAFADEHATVTLVSETLSLRPATRGWLGIKFVHRPGWHTYWINPGDSGLP